MSGSKSEQHLGTDGVSEGHQFQARRLTLFVASTISNKIKYLKSQDKSL